MFERKFNDFAVSISLSLQIYLLIDTEIGGYILIFMYIYQPKQMKINIAIYIINYRICLCAHQCVCVTKLCKSFILQFGNIESRISMNLTKQCKNFWKIISMVLVKWVCILLSDLDNSKVVRKGYKMKDGNFR